MKMKGNLPVEKTQDKTESMSGRTLLAETLIIWASLLLGGLFIIAFTSGWLWVTAEEIPILLRALLYLLSGLMVVGGTYLLIFNIMIEGEPLKVTQEGLYLPVLRVRFKKKSRQRFIPKTEMAGFDMQDSEYGLAVTVTMKSGRTINFHCPVDYRDDLQRFMFQSYRDKNRREQRDESQTDSLLRGL